MCQGDWGESARALCCWYQTDGLTSWRLWWLQCWAGADSPYSPEPVGFSAMRQTFLIQSKKNTLTLRADTINPTPKRNLNMFSKMPILNIPPCAVYHALNWSKVQASSQLKKHVCRPTCKRMYLMMASLRWSVLLQSLQILFVYPRGHFYLHFSFRRIASIHSTFCSVDSSFKDILISVLFTLTMSMIHKRSIWKDVL